jgi:hypothetical protein
MTSRLGTRRRRATTIPAAAEIRQPTRRHAVRGAVARAWGGKNIAATMPHFMAKGTYGCVYRRGFLCSGEIIPEGKRVLSKAARETSSANNEDHREVVVSKLIRKIPRFKQYFAPVLRACRPSAKIRTLLVNDCPPLRDRQGRALPYRILVMNYVGKQTWASRLDGMLRGVKDYARADSRAYWQRQTHTLLSWTLRMNHALALLRAHNICHYDLKNNNIMISEYGSSMPILIDFGLSLPMDTVMQLWAERKWELVYYFYNTSVDYPAWCLEIVLISKICAMAAERAEAGEEDDGGYRTPWPDREADAALRPARGAWQARVGATPFDLPMTFEQDVAPVIDQYFDNDFLQAIPSDRRLRAKRAVRAHYRRIGGKTAEAWMDALLGTWKSWDVSALGFMVWDSVQLMRTHPDTPSALQSLEDLMLQHWILATPRTLSLAEELTRLIQLLEPLVSP